MIGPIIPFVAHRSDRRSFLALSTASLVMDASGADAENPRNESDYSVIQIFLEGGLSHIDSFDPKPRAPSHIRSGFASIPTRIPGVSFTEHLPCLANISDKICLLRGVTHQSAIHESAKRLMLTGVESARPETPSIGAIAAWSERAVRTVPANVSIPSLSQDAGELGQRYGSFAAYGDGSNIIRQLNENGSSRINAIERRLRWRRSFSAPAATEAKGTVAWETENAYRSADERLKSTDLARILQTDDSTYDWRNEFGDSHAGEYCWMASKFIEAGSRFVTVSLGGWDTHFDGFRTLSKNLPIVDKALGGLIQRLENRGLLEKTMVWLNTDFGRTPIFDEGGGRSHWPQAGIGLLAGGRFRRGFVLGETDNEGATVVNAPVTPSDIAKTIIAELGIDPMTNVPPTGRVLLPEGRVLTELIGRT
jgi:hypothetical protein